MSLLFTIKVKVCYLRICSKILWTLAVKCLIVIGFLIETWLAVAFLVIIHIAIYVWVSRKPLRSIRDRHVVISGGSSGIGFWIATNCVKLGAHVTLIARNVDKLKAAVEKIELHRVNEKQLIQFRSVDLATNYDTVKNAFTSLEDEIAPIYWLVNCAGGAICGRVDDLSPEDAVYLMNINYYAVYYPTRYVLTKMKKFGDGIITITGSQASLMGVYGLGPYAAAKFALRGLAETIAMEVSNTKISITLALPADTDTPGFENENKSKPEETKIISAGAGLSKPEDVADKIVTDSLSGNFMSISGFESWMLTVICSGMAPWGGFLFTLSQSVIVGPLRFVVYGIQWHCRSVVKSCAQKSKKDK